MTWRDLAATFAEPGRRDRAPPEGRCRRIRRRSTSSFTTSSGSATSARRTTISATRGTTKTSPSPPSKLFVDILREGPPVGIHTIVWCDSVNNLNRTFDRQGIKEFENRILFQMSANDSSTLIDTPAASKLGENRALYFSEEENRIEKFRPYGVPEQEWLESVKRRFAARPRPEVNGQADGAVEMGRPRSSSRTRPRAPAVDEVVDPPVEAL